MHAEVFLQPDRPHPILGSTHGPTRECLTRNHFRYADPINLGVDLPARKSALTLLGLIFTTCPVGSDAVNTIGLLGQALLSPVGVR